MLKEPTTNQPESNSPTQSEKFAQIVFEDVLLRTYASEIQEVDPLVTIKNRLELLKSENGDTIVQQIMGNYTGINAARSYLASASDIDIRLLDILESGEVLHLVVGEIKPALIAKLETFLTVPEEYQKAKIAIILDSKII